LTAEALWPLAQEDVPLNAAWPCPISLG